MHEQHRHGPRRVLDSARRGGNVQCATRFTALGWEDSCRYSCYGRYGCWTRCCWTRCRGVRAKCPCPAHAGAKTRRVCLVKRPLPSGSSVRHGPVHSAHHLTSSLHRTNALSCPTTRRVSHRDRVKCVVTVRGDHPERVGSISARDSLAGCVCAGLHLEEIRATEATPTALAPPMVPTVLTTPAFPVYHRE
jgi:hypothetical protein